jgi:hypothetical protein
MKLFFDLAVQPDGKIVAAGNSWAGSSWGTIIVGYNPDGSIDSTFGTVGKVFIASVFPEGLALQPNGKIAFAGTIGNSEDKPAGQTHKLFCHCK